MSLSEAQIRILTAIANTFAGSLSDEQEKKLFDFSSSLSSVTRPEANLLHEYAKRSPTSIGSVCRMIDIIETRVPQESKDKVAVSLSLLYLTECYDAVSCNSVLMMFVCKPHVSFIFFINSYLVFCHCFQRLRVVSC